MIMNSFGSIFLSLSFTFGSLNRGRDLNDLDLVSDGSVYGSFAFVLGFTLVFRCQQAYQRYFASAKSLHMMSSAARHSMAMLRICHGPSQLASPSSLFRSIEDFTSRGMAGCLWKLAVLHQSLQKEPASQA